MNERLLAGALVLGALAAAGCSSPAAQAPWPEVIEAPDLSVPPPGDPQGHLAGWQRGVYLFSQDNGGRDPQVLGFRDAVLMRGWQKFGTWGLTARDFDFGYPAATRARGIPFVGGGTASVLFPGEDSAWFDQWSTRDAEGGTVTHEYIGGGVRRGSLAHPGFRAHVVEAMEVQLDGGVDGLFLDEANAGYTGGNQWGWNGNEGYDDWFLAAFNAFLLARHPDFAEADWIATYGMTADNVPRRDVPPGDLRRNFHYRRYLQAHGWAANPGTAQNPLAAVFGAVDTNRLDPAGTTFRDRALLWYWREMVTELREYARARYGKEILVTANGLFPYVDFNSMGLYEGNRDDDGREAAWVPVRGGHLDGAHSQQALYRKVLARSRAISGDVPLVLFLDWPCRTMNSYLALPAAEKEDFWRIFGAEAYANGLFFAFHLRSGMPGEPSAAESQILDFLEGYAAFYQANAEVYTEGEPSDLPVATSVASVAASVSSGGGRTYLHLVNHNYAGGLLAQSGFTASFPLPAAPAAVVLRSPDAAGERPLDFRWADGTLTVTVDRLEAYDLVIVQ